MTTTLSRSLPCSDMCLNAVCLNDQIYVVGLEGSFRYTPDSETWDVLSDLSILRDFVGLCVLDEKVFAIGGRRRGAKDNLYTNIIECFDPVQNKWIICGTLPVPMYSYGCVRVLLNNSPEIDELSHSAHVTPSCSTNSLNEALDHRL